MGANALEPPESEPDLRGLRVLVVEDSADVATAVTNLLRSLGADVLGPVATTDAAMRLTAETNPDVALVDVNLRGGELAYDLIDRLHALRVHIVVMSGNDEVPEAMGKAAAVLEKPVSEARLFASLRAVTSRSSI